MHDSPACDPIDTAALDPGPRNPRPGTTRMCAVSRAVRPVDELIRFVVTPEGDVVADLKRKLPGRGMWITASRAMVEEAQRRRHFSRGFKRQLQVTPTLGADTEKLLQRQAREALGIAAKAGEVKAGFAKVEVALREGSAVALIHASDAAADGTRKLDALVHASDEIRGGKPPIQILQALESAELDLALSRSNVIHAALLGGPASRTFLSRCQMLVRYRSDGCRVACGKSSETIPRVRNTDDQGYPDPRDKRTQDTRTKGGLDQGVNLDLRETWSRDTDDQE